MRLDTGKTFTAGEVNFPWHRTQRCRLDLERALEPGDDICTHAAGCQQHWWSPLFPRLALGGGVGVGVVLEVCPCSGPPHSI